VGAHDDDGSAGDADYRTIGVGYARHRRPEPSIARVIDHALGAARTVCNVGAGTGSYEPPRRRVVAVEPSHTMRSQRAPGRAPCLAAAAEALPFATDAVDASMTTFSVHQWTDLEAGLAEMRRVTRGQVVVMTCDPERLDQFWLAERGGTDPARLCRRVQRGLLRSAGEAPGPGGTEVVLGVELRRR
jgi:hypothetical protein